MTVYKLIALPTEDTLDQFKQWFASAPFSLDYDTLHVLLATSFEPIDCDPEATYFAAPGSIGWWFDPPTAKSHLLLPLFPEEAMIKRHKYIGSVWDMKFVPYMALNSSSINNKHRTKAFINSIATMMVDTAPILTFHAEMCIPSEDATPEHYQFYRDYLARGQVSDQLLSDEDKGIE